MATSEQQRRSRRAAWLAAAVLAAALVVFAGHGSIAASGSSGLRAQAQSAAFAWLRPAMKPAGWKVAMTSSGSRLAYPPGWQAIDGDPGTASAAPAQPRGVFAGYLNATPKAGEETLANWSRFRAAHIAGEGSRDVSLNAAAHGLHFLRGHGSCVVDSYSTSRTRFREIACIVAGSQRTSVVVAAAPLSRWARSAAVLERAIASFSA